MVQVQRYGHTNVSHINGHEKHSISRFWLLMGASVKMRMSGSVPSQMCSLEPRVHTFLPCPNRTPARFAEMQVAWEIQVDIDDMARGKDAFESQALQLVARASMPKLKLDRTLAT